MYYIFQRLNKVKTMSKQQNHNQDELPGSDGTHNMILGSHGMIGTHVSPGLQSASVLQVAGTQFPFLQ